MTIPFSNLIGILFAQQNHRGAYFKKIHNMKKTYNKETLVMAFNLFTSGNCQSGNGRTLDSKENEECCGQAENTKLLS